MKGYRACKRKNGTDVGKLQQTKRLRIAESMQDILC